MISKRVSRIDGEEKVLGKAKYADDFRFQGMLYGEVLRSPYPHAKITNINTSKAKSLKGVEAVICGKDVSKELYGRYLEDNPIFATDKVRFIGDPVSAVAAVDDDTAKQALDLIEINYEEMEPLFDPGKAMEKDAVLIHENLGQYRHLPVCHPVTGTNVCDHYKLRKGDVDKAFGEAYMVYENKYTTQIAHLCYLEPHIVIASTDMSGNITLHCNSQAPFAARDQLALIFHIPASKIRVIVPYIGGGFGGKATIKLEAIAISLAQKTGKPVRVIMSREEEFTTSSVRHPSTSYLKIGVARDGRLLSIKENIIWDTGAYADIGPSVSSLAGCCAAGPYRIPNIWIDSHCVYTNNIIGGAFRGFGVPQVTWAMESQMDIIAKDLGIDPLDLRLKNVVVEGSISATGEKLHSVGVKGSLRAAANAINWGKKRPTGRGIGIACMHKFTAQYGETSIIIRINDDGSVRIFKGAVEMGQGIDTALTQITAEVLGTTVDRISVASIDTEFTPYDWATASSRSTFFSGNATKHAAKDVKKQLINVASEMLEIGPDKLVCTNGRVFENNQPERGVSFQQIARYSHSSSDGLITGKGGFAMKRFPMDAETGQSERPAAYWMYGSQAAEVEVDTETGEVKILKLTAAHDVGRAINPTNCSQQIEGSLVTGLGTTIYEELVMDTGKAANASFIDYKIPRANDIPELISILIDDPHREGPFGAKGLGEPGLAPTAPAISNAIYNAIGVRIKELPITPEKILAAIKAKKS